MASIRRRSPISSRVDVTTPSGLGQGIEQIGKAVSVLQSQRKKRKAEREALRADIDMFEQAQPLEEMYLTAKNEEKRNKDNAQKAQEIADKEREMTFGGLQDLSIEEAKSYAAIVKERQDTQRDRDVAQATVNSSFESTRLYERKLDEARAGGNIDDIFESTKIGQKEIDDRYTELLDDKGKTDYLTGNQRRGSQNAESFMRSLSNIQQDRRDSEFRKVFGDSISQVFSGSDFTGDMGFNTIKNILDSAELYISTSPDKKEQSTFIRSKIRAGLSGVVNDPRRVAEGYSILNSGALNQYFDPKEITAIEESLAENRETMEKINRGRLEMSLSSELDAIQNMALNIPADTPVEDVESMMTKAVEDMVSGSVNEDGSPKYTAQHKEVMMSYIPSTVATRSRTASDGDIAKFNKASNGRELSSRVSGLQSSLSNVKTLINSDEKAKRLRGTEDLADLIGKIGNLERDPSFTRSSLTRDKSDSTRIQIAKMKMDTIRMMSDMEKKPGKRGNLSNYEDARLFPRIEKMQDEILFPAEGSTWSLIDAKKRTDISSLLADGAFKAVQDNMAQNGDDAIDIFEGNVEELVKSLAEQARDIVLGEGEKKAMDTYKPTKKVVEDIQIQNMALQRMNLGDTPQNAIAKLSEMLQKHAGYSEPEAIESATSALQEVSRVSSPSVSIPDTVGEDIISEVFSGPTENNNRISENPATVRLIMGEENGRDGEDNPLPGKLVGYVPSGGNSGVTIASGLDLGEKSEDELVNMGIPKYLAEKLGVFAGLKGLEADEVARSLVITEDERDIIDNAVIAHSENKAKITYEQESGKRFADLTDTQRAVLASVTHQYGSLTATPKFLGFVSRGDWDGALSELRDFGDNFTSRRNREADFIEGKLD